MTIGALLRERQRPSPRLSHRGGRAIATVAALTLLLAGCGGSATPASSPPPPSSAAAKPASAAAAPSSAAAKPAASAKPATSGSAAASGAGEKVNVAITNGSLTGAGVYIAIDRGYFKDQGLNVTITGFPGAAQMIPSVASSQVDVANMDTGAGVWNALARDLPMKLVADGSHCDKVHCGTAFTVRKDLVDSGRFKDIKDLKGLSTNTFIGGSTLYQFVYRMLDMAGLKESDVKLQKIESFADVLPAISNKALDTSWMIEPLTTAGIDKGIISQFKTATDLFGPQQNTVITYSPDFATKRTETAKKFMAAYIKGLRDYDDAIDSGKEYDAIIGILTKESALKDPALYKKLGLPAFDPNGALLLDATKTTLKWFEDHGDVKTPVDVDKVYDPQFLNYAMSVDGKR